MEEISQSKIAVAGTKTDKKSTQPTQEQNDLVLEFLHCKEEPQNYNSIGNATGLSMIETAKVLMNLIKERKVSKVEKNSFIIYFRTDEDIVMSETQVVASNTRGPARKPGSIKNYAKYLFEGNNYGKGKLVLALVKSYVKSYPEKGVNEIQEAFPKKLHGKFNVVEEVKTAASKSEKQRRFFLDANQVIVLSNDTKLAVCSQWGSNNVNSIIDHCVEVLGFVIEGNNG